MVGQQGEIQQLSLTVFAIGNGLYAILSVFGSAALPIMFVSRFLVGISSANIAIVRSYISTSTTTSERTTAVALTSAAQGLGFIIGPAVQAALAVAFAHTSPNSSNSTLTNGTMSETLVDTDAPTIELNMYSATGWIGVFLGVTNLFLFFPCTYQEHPIAAREAQLQRRLNRDESTKLPKPDYVPLVGVIFSFFNFLFIYVLLETIIVPMCIDLYAWTDEKAITLVGIGLSVAGAFSVVMFALSSILTKRYDERKVLIILGIIPLILANLILFPMGSNYPKMKNCSTDDPLHIETFSNLTTFAPQTTDLLLTTLPGDLPVNIVDMERRLLTALAGEINIISEENTTGTPIPSVEEVTLLSEGLEPSTTIQVELISTASEPIVSPTPRERHIIPGEMYFNNSEARTLSRRRRHAIRRETCDDLGCPPEQKWCLYTPIIEIPQLIVGTFMASVGYPVAFTLASSLFSKLLGPKPQGVWMGILTSAGSLSRVTGPICVSYMYTVLGTRWTFGVLFLLMILTFIINLCLYRRLVPMKVVRNLK
ncbi:major facilitator superfamily domain-containing protein 8-like isoform X3 [Homarus americanus]|uniref:major facilitator superfamily domain-containing protein 8-like isoform X3 n=1 Tax=Homarus americanus TaxID=6706 RepID=UPI001C472E33|nr:major facilitator superfamily domain-containing protein 8-like isoform X3 [Homarus americanus]